MPSQNRSLTGGVTFLTRYLSHDDTRVPARWRRSHPVAAFSDDGERLLTVLPSNHLN